MVSKYNQFSTIFGALRRCWSRHPRKRAILHKAKHPTICGPRGGSQYICASCKETFGLGAVNVDHIEPVVPINTLSKDMSWDEIIGRMFNCDDDNLQVLCKECHKKKSKEESVERREFKKNAKDKKEDKGKCNKLSK